MTPVRVAPEKPAPSRFAPTKLALVILAPEKFDPETLASRGYRNEQLDQLVIDTILGA